MERNVSIAVLVLIKTLLVAVDSGPPPFSITIDCGPPKGPFISQPQKGAPGRLGAAPAPTLCDCIARSLPAIQDGRLSARDQQPAAAALGSAALALPPPRPRLPPPALTPERVQKGVQKMMHMNNLLGHFNLYMSDRTKILVKGLAKAAE